jgi:hypothetical protein
MNGIEERLRDELKDFAQRAQPGSVRPLRAPAPRRRPRTARWLTPVAAATAVVAVVAGLTLAGRAVGRQPASRGPGRISAYPGMPAYYVVLEQRVASSHGRHIDIETADVYDTVTGRLLDKVQVPEDGAYAGNTTVTAAANDRVFAISGADNSLFVLRLAANGHCEGLRRLPVKDARELYTSPALSPDGSHLAYLARVCGNGGCAYGVGVMPIAQPSAAKFWLWLGLAPGNLSWAPDGKQVMFDLAWGKLIARDTQYRLLNVAGLGGDLLTESRQISLPVGMRGQRALLTPGARSVVGSMVLTGPGRHGVTGEIVEMSRSTGRLRQLYVTKTRWNGDCGVLSLAPTGVQPLVFCYGKFGLIEDGRFTARPGYPARWMLLSGWNAAW